MQITVNVKLWGLVLDFLNTLCHSPRTPLLLAVSQSTTTHPSFKGWLDCSFTCSSIWSQSPSARAVWDVWGRLPAQEEGEACADCKWQWMVEWIVPLPIIVAALAGRLSASHSAWSGSQCWVVVLCVLWHFSCCDMDVSGHCACT